MSDPQRYSFHAVIMHHIDGPDTAEIRFRRENDGLFVQWEDYARLKAEVAELKNQPDPLTAYLYAAELAKDEVKHLKAEVERLRASSFVTAVPVEQYERLRKAGDALYESEIGYYGEQILNDMKHHSGELCRNWNAAKEGKPSV